MRRQVLLLYLTVASAAFLWEATTARRQRHTPAKLQRDACTDHSTVKELIMKARCRAVEQPLKLPVPKGFDTVHPAVVLVTRCEGMTCHPRVHSCLPIHSYSYNRTIQVYAHYGNLRKCLEITVEEHRGCQCGCKRECPNNQILNEAACECECDPRLQEVCEARSRLWDTSTCECVCPVFQEVQCSSGEVFINELCRCEAY
ncbi:balbiani ring protein 3-like [Homarus americanus]|uniref:balbiani ring protein 3-like n=1 Tax=Homarus americanus TaxID=6706 RepID=UPI001C48ED36|nr:balbiani ring protein 3-like [Homarus americanus]